MFDRFRDRIAYGLMALANRVTRDPRYPAGERVAQSMRTLAGVMITPDTAVKISAVWACLRYLSQTVAALPWHVMKDGDKGAEINRSHPSDYIISKRASDEWSSFQFRETLIHWALRWGNGYAEVERDQLGRPFALHPIHPERVQVCRDVETGKLYYEVTNDGGGGKIEIAAKDMFHLRGFGEGPVGVNVIHYAAESLGWAHALQLFGASFFGNGATPATVVRNKKALTPDGLERQRKEFAQLYKGPRNSNKTAHLDADAEIEVIGINARNSQLIESQQHAVEEIARWFGVPPHKIQHLLRSTFSNIESQAIEVVVDSVTPWVKRLEDEADFKLFGAQNRQGFYTKINMRGLLRGDHASRAAYYQAMWNMGCYSPNDILEREDENTLGPDGDKHFVQAAFVTLENAGELPMAAAPPTVPNLEEDAASIAARRGFEKLMGQLCLV